MKLKGWNESSYLRKFIAANTLVKKKKNLKLRTSLTL